MSRLQEVLGPGREEGYIWQTLMRRNIITKEWLADFYAEGVKPKYRGALKRTSSQARERSSAQAQLGRKPKKIR